jgi:hypothetical protein
MPREGREIWTPEKRNIIREWRVWAKKHSESAKGDTAVDEFHSHLQRESAELLTSLPDNKIESIRGWLAEEGLIS